MICNVFDTLEEAEAAQEADFQLWKSAQPQHPEKYWNTTTKWADVRQRETDGKYYYTTCPQGSQEHTQETFQPNWLPPENNN